ncbi:MAG TPA: thioredoxin family protein [Erysipelotrichaceae bacterium]|nr:thioredoxin family protein [Erysipelotrichaceae bacterium]
MLKIEVLGTGCRNCKALLTHTKEAVESLGCDAEVSYVDDLEKIMSYGVMSTPALVINGQVAASGRVLKRKDVEKLIKESI